MKIATDRGWKFVRKGGHNQIIIEYPETGARMYLWSSPKTRPNPRQIMAVMTGKERSTRTTEQNAMLDWICDAHGIPADSSGVVEKPLIELAEGYLGRPAKDKREKDRMVGALTNSDRVWLLGMAERGSGAKTKRLVLGRDAVLTEEELAEVRSWPQVNHVFDDLPTVQERLDQMKEFIEARGFERFPKGMYSHRRLGLFNLSIPKAYEAAQNVPVVKAIEPTPDPEPDPSPTEAPTEPSSDDGIIVVSGEPGVHSEKWLDEQAAKTVGLPVALVAALREALQIDNKNVISGMDMVRESLDAAIDGATTMVKALEELSAAIDLIKVEA